MIKEYTEDMMVQRWLLREGLAPSPGVTGLSDNSRLREVIVSDLRHWYADLLLTASPLLLPTEDVSEETESIYLTKNSAQLTLPSRCVRPINIKMENWQFSVYTLEKMTPKKAEDEARQALCSTPFTPHAYRLEDGTIEVHGLNRGPDWLSYYVPQYKPKPGPVEHPRIERLVAVITPPSGSYILDESLLP
ncbi:MAG: hypothetical protein NC201_07910 [Prevotella sp.]|nr:hypothetical protein [Bacteroides sp.]MCM1367153.1 hypothetical protein [Prevotella sp.]